MAVQDTKSTAGEKGERPRRGFKRWLLSAPRRTLVLYPLAIILIETALHRGWPEFVPWGTVFLIWGYAQLRLASRYRRRLGGGGPGAAAPPERIVVGGPYGLTRNPIYLGHLIFMAGLAVCFNSCAALALLTFHMAWYHRRVLEDERRLEALFGPDYLAYKKRVKRWIPFVL